MSGWLLFVVLAAPALAGLWLVAGRRRSALGLAALAVAAAAAGYAWQGHPGLGGHAVTPADTRRPIDTLFADERKAWLETVGPDPQVLDAADMLIARGDADYAVGVLRGAIARRPGSAPLWIGLGNALVQYADGNVTPAARFAYARAAALAPGVPAPVYFLGLAYALSGDFDNADRAWRALLATAPPEAPWRASVALKLMLLERLQQSR